MLRSLPPGEMDPYQRLKLTVILPNIETALSCIQQGTYGICLGCGESIPEKRLLAIPGALRCVPCQTAKEDEMKRSEDGQRESL